MDLEYFLPGGHPETGKSAGERHDPHPLRETNLPFSYLKTMVLEHFLLEGHPATEKSAGERHDPPPFAGGKSTIFLL